MCCVVCVCVMLLSACGVLMEEEFISRSVQL